MISVGIIHQPHEAQMAGSHVKRLTEANIEVVTMPVPSGSSIAFNRQRLVAKATTKYFTWLDPDDGYDPAFLDPAVQLMEENEKLGMVQGIEEAVRAGKVLWTTKGKPKPDLRDLENSVIKFHSGVVFRTEYLQAFSCLLPADKFSSLEHLLRVAMAHRYDYTRIDEPGYRWVQHKDQHHRRSLPTGLLDAVQAVRWVKSRKPELFERMI